MADKLLNKFKKFLDEKKADKYFKKSGPGHSLSGSGPSTAPTHNQHAHQQQQQQQKQQQQARSPLTFRKISLFPFQNVRSQRPADKLQLAEAALSRVKDPSQQGMTRSQKVIHEQARRELEREKATAHQDPDGLFNVQQHEARSCCYHLKRVMTFFCRLMSVSSNQRRYSQQFCTHAICSVRTDR